LFSGRKPAAQAGAPPGRQEQTFVQGMEMKGNIQPGAQVTVIVINVFR
jgi:hypothetical protein